MGTEGISYWAGRAGVPETGQRRAAAAQGHSQPQALDDLGRFISFFLTNPRFFWVPSATHQYCRYRVCLRPLLMPVLSVIVNGVCFVGVVEK